MSTPDDTNPNPEAAGTDPGSFPPVTALEAIRLENWKDAMRTQFSAWLDELDAVPEPEEDQPETPDLYSFYSQWIAANAESRKGNRRTAEAFSKWNDVLSHFEGDLKLLREQWQRVSASAAAEGLSRTHCLVLVEMLDRLERVARAFDSTPAKPWWGGGGAWQKAWESQRQAFDILVGHFESLLKQEGLTRIETLGQPFDPAAMAAVAAQPDSSCADQTVLQEVLPGYRLRGELLRTAQVKVSVNKPKNT